MTLQSITSTGTASVPPILLIHSAGGVGKSTLGASMPSPFFLDAEKSTENMDVARCLPETFKNVDDYLAMFWKEKHDYKTLVVDTLDWIEKLAIKDVFKANNIKSLDELGHGAAYVQVDGKILSFYNMLRCIHDQGIMICLLCHNAVKDYVNPTGKNYRKIVLKTQRSGTGEMFIEWSKMVGYLHRPVMTSDDKKDMDGFKKKTKAIQMEQVVLSCVPNASYESKNRYHISQDIQIPEIDGWSNLQTAITANK